MGKKVKIPLRQQPEKWKKIPCEKGYEASTHGRIKKLAYTAASGREFQERIIDGSHSSSGAILVRVNGRVQLRSKLVMMTWNGGYPKDYDPDFDVIMHLGDYDDDAPDMLQWSTRSAVKTKYELNRRKGVQTYREKRAKRQAAWEAQQAREYKREKRAYDNERVGWQD